MEGFFETVQLLEDLSIVDGDHQQNITQAKVCVCLEFLFAHLK